MRLKLIPFQSAWVTTTGQSGAPLLDIHAIYRRPQKNRFGDPILDAAGFVIWDLTSAIPMQHHAKWTTRGFEYVTLADRESLIAVANPNLREHGIVPLHDWQSYVQNRLTDGPWDATLYLKDLADERAAQIAQLRQAIEKFGAEAAELMEQRSNPAYRLPEAFRVAPDVASRLALGAIALEPPVRKKPGRKPKAEAVPA